MTGNIFFLNFVPGRKRKETWKINFSSAILPCMDHTPGVSLYNLKAVGVLSWFFSLRVFWLLMQ